MSWLDRLFDLLSGAGGRVSVIGQSETGEVVSDTTAEQLPVVEACLSALAGPIGSLPLQVFRRRADGGRDPAQAHPLAPLLAKRPHPDWTAWELRSQMQRWLAWHRNAYAEILPGARGAIDTLRPIHPKWVWPERIAGRLWYRVTESGQPPRLLAPEEIWHLRATPLADNGLRGRSVIETNSEVIGAAIAVHKYGNRFFRNDGQSGGVLEHPGSFKTSEDRDTFLDAWRKARTGANRHRDAVLEFGIKYNRAGMDNQKSQFLETRKENWLDVARLWRIPPHKVGILDQATFSNIEHQAIEFLTDCLLPWLELWEQKINTELLLDDDHFAEFNVAGLLRGDLKTQYEAFQIGRNGGWLSINDIRRILNMPPIANGDDHLQPLNMIPAGTVVDRPARPAAQMTAADLGLP